MGATGRGHGPLLHVLVSPVADPATVFFAMRVPVRPVHEPTLIVPLEDAAKTDAIAQPHRHAARQVEVMGDQHRLPARQLHDKPLVPGAVMVVGDQACHVAGVLDPAVVVRLVVALLYGRVIRP